MLDTEGRHIVDQVVPYGYTAAMGERLRKITVNVLEDALDHATRITGKGLTSTIVAGLRELERRAKRSALRQLKGKVRFALDLEKTRR